MNAGPEAHVGIRELRSGLAAHVRRAGMGDSVVVTIDGKPVARLGPLGHSARPTVDDLVAAGLIEPPRRTEPPPPAQPNTAAAGMRVRDVLRELRGR